MTVVCKANETQFRIAPTSNRVRGVSYITGRHALAIMCAAEHLRMALQMASDNVFGVRLNRLTVADTLSILAETIPAGAKRLFVDQNLHGIYMLSRDKAFAQLHALPQTMVRVDGMPLIWLGRISGARYSPEHRVTWLDLVWPLLESCDRNSWKVFFVGGSDAVAQAAVRAVKQRYPNIQFEAASGYFDKQRESEGNRRVLAQLADFAPNVLLVGMGMGVQEKWLLENAAALPANATFTVGALFEYVTGVVKTPPRWLGKIGFEWLFRFAENPSRFWFRYLVEPVYVAGFLARGAWRQWTAAL